MNRCAIQGLYVIADTGVLAAGALENAVAQALRGGAAVVQYRNKQPMTGAMRAEAAAIRTLCRRARAPLIVNDDVALAQELGADGVHLGRDDADVETARRRVGDAMLVGTSCYNDLQLALAAQASGADYVAFGSFFCSPTKPAAAAAPVELLRQGRRALELPIVAIGGITPDNGAQLLEAGADALAVVSGVFGRPDPEAAAYGYTRLFRTGGHRDSKINN